MKKSESRGQRSGSRRAVMVGHPVYPGTLEGRRFNALQRAVLSCLHSEKLMGVIDRRLHRLNAGGAR